MAFLLSPSLLLFSELRDKNLHNLLTGLLLFVKNFLQETKSLANSLYPIYLQVKNHFETLKIFEKEGRKAFEFSKQLLRSEIGVERIKENYAQIRRAIEKGTVDRNWFVERIQAIEVDCDLHDESCTSYVSFIRDINREK